MPYNPKPNQPGNGDRKQVEALIEEYNRLCHAMQTGVAYVSQLDPKHISMKYARTGVNSALVSHSALVKLLIGRGVITEAEYWQAVVREMAEEVERYKQQLFDMTGGKTTFELH